MAQAHFAKSTRDECQEFWRKPTDGKNSPEQYRKHIERSAFLYQVFRSCSIQNQSRILELGCNMGRNLNFLYYKGYKDLTGVEISAAAIDYCRKVYPDLNVTLHCSAIEDIIKDFEDGQFDVIFTCAVLQHIHIDSNWIFAEMARVANQYIIIIEDNSRDYKAIFEKLGFVQECELACSRFIDMKKKYVARVFRKPEKGVRPI